MSAEDDLAHGGEPAAGSNLDAEPKKRLAPKLGLQGMVLFIMDLRLRARMRDGEDADQTYALLEKEDLERLEDIADTLEYFRLSRAKARLTGNRQ